MRFAPNLPDDLPDWLTPQQLADLLAVTTGSIRNWVKRGKLPRPVVVSDRIRLFSSRAVRRCLARLVRDLREAAEGNDLVDRWDATMPPPADGAEEGPPPPA